MARSRGIKPGFFRNADMVELPMEARLLFIGLWTLADRDGRLEDRPKQIKMEIFPADNVDCDALIEQIAQTGMLARYEVAGKRYLQVVNFTKHQNPHRDERASTIPDPPGNHNKTTPTPRKHGASTVQTPCKKDASTVGIGLTPDSGLLTPDSRLLTPDSSSPAAGETEPALRGDDEKPKSPAEWTEVFAEQHGVDVDHRNFHDRKKFWPLAQAWTNAGVTVGQMRSACAKAHADCTEPIAWLPAYADRVLASMQAVKNIPPTEPAWRTEQRAAVLQAVPGIAAKSATARSQAARQSPEKTIDVESRNVATVALG